MVAGSAHVGLSPAGAPFKVPGGVKDSFSYHGSTGDKSSDGEDWKSYGPKFAYNDNGEFLGVAFRGVPRDLYPTVGIWDITDTVEANFGQESFECELDWDKLRRLCRE